MAADDRSALPYPGDELVMRVTGVTGVVGDALRNWFEVSGERSVQAMEAALGLRGRELRSFARVLDFGCGPGRILLWLRDVAEAGVELHGCDIDVRAIRWARAHVPWARFDVNAPLPPLPYADGTFDCVLNHSVFTHLDEDYQDRWLAELHRITAPGALLLLSVNGDHAFAEFERHTRANGGDPAAVRAAREAQGLVFLTEDSWLGSAYPDFYHSTFHTPGYVMQRWSWFFEVHAYLPRHALGHQDVVVLERRDSPLPEEEPPRFAQAAAAAPQPVIVPAGVSPFDVALERVAGLLDLPPGRGADEPSSHGRAGVAARQGLLWLMRPYTWPQRRLDRALFDALAQLKVALEPLREQAAAVGGLRDAVIRQSERMSRLELELLDRLDRLETLGDVRRGAVEDPEP